MCLHPFVAGLGKLYNDAQVKVAAASGISPGGLSCPHVPYVGSRYDKACPRILYVGRTTYGWRDTTLKRVLDEGWSYTKLAEESDLFIRGRVIPACSGVRPEDPYYSPFWRAIYLLTAATQSQSDTLWIEKDEVASRRAFESIAWLNVHAIGTEMGTHVVRAKLGHWLCCQLPVVRLAIENLKPRPDVVVLSTGKRYDHYVQEMLGGVPALNGATELVETCVNRIPLLRPKYHFQGLSHEDLEHVYARLRAIVTRSPSHVDCRH